MDPKTIEALKNRTLLIVGAADDIRDQLTTIFNDLSCQTVFVADYTLAHRALRDGAKPDLILLNVTSPINKSFKFIRELRMVTLEPPPLFMLTDQLDVHLDEAFYEGLEAIFAQPIQATELVTGIAFSYSALLGHKNRKHDRKQVQHAKVTVTIDAQPANGYATNISMGGLFCGGTDRLPAKSQHIKFKLTFEDKGHMIVIGIGIVRWVRAQMEFGRPRGFGVEFLGLDSRSRTVLQDLLGIVPEMPDAPVSIVGRRPK